MRPDGTGSPLVIRTEAPSALAEYARVPIAFTVRERLALDGLAIGRAASALRTVPVHAPYVKDYDASPDDHPTAWASRFDVGRWTILSAWCEGARVGGAVVVCDAADVAILGGGRALAVLWDLRVAPAARGQGIGQALFRAAAARARARGARGLQVETQDVNVPACRFYARQGCTLAAVRADAYPSRPDEAQLLWECVLGGADCPSDGRQEGGARHAP